MTRWYKIQRAVRDPSVPRAISKGLHNYANTYVFHGINLPRKRSRIDIGWNLRGTRRYGE